MSDSVISYYSVLRFCPYRETDEFVNIGVVLACPSRGFLDFRVEPKRYGRVTHFFPELDVKVYRGTLKSFRGMLHVACSGDIGKQVPTSLEQHRILQAFREVVRPRETIMLFSEPRVIRTKEPKVTLDDLFSAYVERRFAHTEEYQEKIMSRHLEQLLEVNQLSARFERNKAVGGKLFRVLMSFVEFDQTHTAKKAMKPLDLDKEEPTDVIRHADAWSSNLKRLAEYGFTPDKILFMVRPPRAPGDPQEAFKRVVSDFKGIGVNVSLENEPGKILDFARQA